MHFIWKTELPKEKRGNLLPHLFIFNSCTPADVVGIIDAYERMNIKNENKEDPKVDYTTYNAKINELEHAVKEAE